MRTITAFALWAALLAGTQGAPAALAGLHATLSPTVVAAQQPSGELDVDVDVSREGGGAWYTNPVWLAIGGLAILVVLALLVIAIRGGGTTIVRD